MDEDFVYSLDGEMFYPLDEVMAELEGYYEPGKHTVQRGVPRRLTHLDFIFGDRIIESIQESYWDEHGEYSEDYLMCITDDEKKELETLIADWLTLKAGDIKFFVVDNIEDVVLSTD